MRRTARSLAASMDIGNPVKPLRRTMLYNLHRELGGKFGPFAGYELPIMFPAGIVGEHEHTRSAAGLFDVSHMGQMRFDGKDREKFLAYVTPIDFQSLPIGQGRLSFIPNEKGGVKDDCIITRYDDYEWLVCNASNKQKIIDHFTEELSKFDGDCTMHVTSTERGLLAVQGPEAAKVMSAHVPDLQSMTFMDTRRIAIDGVPCQMTRCGYTGEDGFEISIPLEKVEQVAKVLLDSKDGAVKPIGLGARDTLRMEAGMCLYGHELSEDVNPVAAKLMWCINKRRVAEGGFIGYDAIMNFRNNAQTLVPQLRVGIVSPSPVAREGSEIVELENGESVGIVTSGLRSPTLKKNIAQAYIRRDLTQKGMKVVLCVKAGKKVEGEIVPFPFVNTKYYKP